MMLAKRPPNWGPFRKASGLGGVIRRRVQRQYRPITTLSEFDMKRCEKLVAQFIEKRRPPPHIRREVDLSFRINGQSVEIFEVRPNWRDRSKLQEHSIAKANCFINAKAI